MAELQEIKDEKVKEQQNAEDAIITRPLLIMMLCIFVGAIVLIIGINQWHGEALIIIGIATIISTILWFSIITPLLKVIAHISKNLREINRKLK